MEENERLSLARAVANMLEECRTVVPGIQGLFGFQLIVVFNATFEEKLSHGEQSAHAIAILLTVVSLVCIMTPAAYHRMTGPREASSRFIVITTRLLLVSMATLALAIAIDTTLVMRLVFGLGAALTIGTALLVLLGALWYALPVAARVRKRPRNRALEALGLTAKGSWRTSFRS